MKRYPKVPRHDLEFVPEALFEVEDLVLLEKVDGMNFRFMLYEDRFEDEYEDIVLDKNPQDGDIVFGTKGVGMVRGVVRDPIGEFEPKLETGIRALRRVDKDAMRDAHNQYGSLVWFAEHMTRHSIDYDYDTNPPPELIGFDVYSPRRDDRTELPSNPYKEKFVGYLDVETMENLFDEIGLVTSPRIKFKRPFSTQNFNVPMSEFGNVQAEGVVIRSDSMEMRSKYVRESFKEMNKSAMGGYSKEEEPDIWFVDVVVTPARVRNKISKLVNNHGYELSTNEEFINLVTREVLVDGWEEEFSEIREIDTEVNPSNIHEPAHRRVKNVVERMRQMNERISGSLISDSGTNENVNTRSSIPDVSSIDRRISEAPDEHTEREIIDILVGMGTIERVVEDMGKNRNLGGWAVEPATEKIRDMFWAENPDVLSNLHIEFNPAGIDRQIMNIVKEEIENQADVDLNRGGDGWNPEQEDIKTEGIGEIL